LKKIGIVTSGGDAPGMNAAIRAIVRVAHARDLKVLGFEEGWKGLMANKSMALTPRGVGGILQLGGTFLHTARCPEFTRKESVEKAAEVLSHNEVEGLVVIGGNGSFNGALDLSKKSNTLIVGIPATIDNDVFGVDETIGFDTAVNTIVSEIDKIRDTAISHERIFIVEVMGRTRGFLALTSGITAGAEVILVPEIKYKIENVIQTIKENSMKGKKSGVIVAAEGVGDTRRLAREIEEHAGSEVRLSVLGYAQRGGSPTVRSRLLASLFGNKAVELFLSEQGNKIVGLQNGRIASINLEESCKKEKPLDLDLLALAKILAT
jgi:6-phosphofructokinase 1